LRKRRDSKSCTESALPPLSVQVEAQSQPVRWRTIRIGRRDLLKDDHDRLIEILEYVREHCGTPSGAAAIMDEGISISTGRACHDMVI
ncbi:unnamed protein product, partial [Pocillopora meandrina]